MRAHAIGSAVTGPDEPATGEVNLLGARASENRDLVSAEPVLLELRNRDPVWHLARTTQGVGGAKNVEGGIREIRAKEDRRVVDRQDVTTRTARNRAFKHSVADGVVVDAGAQRVVHRADTGLADHVVAAQGLDMCSVAQDDVVTLGPADDSRSATNVSRRLAMAFRCWARFNRRHWDDADADNGRRNKQGPRCTAYSHVDLPSR